MSKRRTLFVDGFRALPNVWGIRLLASLRTKPFLLVTVVHNVNVVEEHTVFSEKWHDLSDLSLVLDLGRSMFARGRSHILIEDYRP
jgi:hypothetical protein